MEQVRDILERDGGAIVPVHKPAGVSSFAVVQAVRRQLGVRKAGHAGTLDPLASGLLVVGVGAATKQLTGYVGLPKTYEANVRIGEARSTGDLEGAVVAERSVDEDIPEAAVNTALKELIGTHELPVPAYSAVKQGGVAFYKRARAAAARGEHLPDTPTRPMRVMNAALRAMGYENVPTAQGHSRRRAAWLTVQLHVGSGTYVRSLAEFIGQQLGYPATLTSLVRTAVGAYRLEDAYEISLDRGD